MSVVRPRSASSSDDETWCFVENSMGDILDVGAELDAGAKLAKVDDEIFEVKRKTTTSSGETQMSRVETPAEQKTDVILEEPEPKVEEHQQELEIVKQQQSFRLVWEAKIISAFAILFMLFWSIGLSIATPGDVLLFLRIAKLKTFGYSESVPGRDDPVESFDLYNSIGSDYSKSYMITRLELYNKEKRGTNFVMKPEMDYIEIPPLVIKKLPMPKKRTLELPSGEKCMKPHEDVPKFARKYHKKATSTTTTTLPAVGSSQHSLPSTECTVPGFAKVCAASIPSISTPTTLVPGFCDAASTPTTSAPLTSRIRLSKRSSPFSARSSQPSLPSTMCTERGLAPVCDAASMPTTSTAVTTISTGSSRVSTRSSRLLRPSKRCTALRSYASASKSLMTTTESAYTFMNRSSDWQNYTAYLPPSDVAEVANVSLYARSSSSNSTQNVASMKGELGAPCIQPKDVELVLAAAAGKVYDLSEALDATKASLFQCHAARRALEQELQEEKSRRAVALGEARNARDEVTLLKQTRSRLLVEPAAGSLTAKLRDVEDYAASGSLTAKGRDVEDKCNCNCKCNCDEKDYFAALASSNESNESSCTLTTSVATVGNAKKCAKQSKRVSSKQLKAMKKRHREEMKRLRAKQARDMVNIVNKYEKKLEELKRKMYKKH